MQVCLRRENVSDCANSSHSARELSIYAEANLVMLTASAAMSVSGMAVAPWLSFLGDSRGRRAALLLPFIGLLLADISLLLQTLFLHSSPFWFVLSELLFGLFGGYMAIIAGAFALVSSQTPDTRSTSIARLEGALGFGGSSLSVLSQTTGTVGFFLSSQLHRTGYTAVVVFFMAVHVLCVLLIACLPQPVPQTRRSRTPPVFIKAANNAILELLSLWCSAPQTSARFPVAHLRCLLLRPRW